MASFTDIIAHSIFTRRAEFLTSLSPQSHDRIEQVLSAGVRAHWHPLPNEKHDDMLSMRVGAVDGSRAIRSLNSGADWVIAQALLLCPDGVRFSEGDTRLLRGDIEGLEVDRYASLFMRSLELELALKFVQEGHGDLLLLDGSLYADLPYLLYRLTIEHQEDLPLKVLGQYLDLFALCQQRDVLLLGIAKSTRSKVFGHALLEESESALQIPQVQSDALPTNEQASDVMESENDSHPLPSDHGTAPWLPSDGELLHRWTEGCGLTDPLLLGSASFGHTSARRVAQLAQRTKHLSSLQDHLPAHLSPLQQRLLAAPAIGTFYVRLAPGDDVLRVDALASAFGRADLHLLEFAQAVTEYTTALPIVHYLLGDYGGLAVYNAALYVVDQEVRLHATTVDQIYLPMLRQQLGQPIQYDRSTRRFFS